jgi:hypothetical protein
MPPPRALAARPHRCTSHTTPYTPCHHRLTAYPMPTLIAPLWPYPFACRGSTQELLEQQHRCLTLDTPVPLVRSTAGSDEFVTVNAIVPSIGEHHRRPFPLWFLHALSCPCPHRAVGSTRHRRRPPLKPAVVGSSLCRSLSATLPMPPHLGETPPPFHCPVGSPATIDADPAGSGAPRLQARC